MRLRFGGVLVAAVLALGGGSVSLAQEVKKEPVERLISSAEQGSAEAQRMVGIMYYMGLGGASQDYAKAFEWFSKAAAQGDAEAQYKLGLMYANGEGVRQDYAKAREWYEQAAAKGDVMSQITLGLMYYNGEGVRQNKKTAKEWFGKACDNGEQIGCDAYRELNEAGY